MPTINVLILKYLLLFFQLNFQFLQLKSIFVFCMGKFSQCQAKLSPCNSIKTPSILNENYINQNRIEPPRGKTNNVVSEQV